MQKIVYNVLIKRIQKLVTRQIVIEEKGENRREDLLCDRIKEFSVNLGRDEKWIKYELYKGRSANKYDWIKR